MGMWLKTFKITTLDQCRVITKNGFYIPAEKFPSGKVNRGLLFTICLKLTNLFVIYLVNNPKRSTSS